MTGLSDRADVLPDIESIPHELRVSCRIRTSRDGTWQPAEDGFEAFLMPVQDGLSGEPIDVVAWDVMEPAVWWLRSGQASFAGERAILWANQESRPLEVVTTPDEYLKRWGFAVCILDWRADVRAILAQVQKGVFCVDAGLEARMRKILDQQPSDQILLNGRAA